MDIQRDSFLQGSSAIVQENYCDEGGSKEDAAEDED
jgi:hypothetical protein